MTTHFLTRVLKFFASAVFAVAFLGAFSTGALAQPASLGPPVGKVLVHQLSVAFIGSAGVGGGTLSFGGRRYRFKLAGLGVGGFGASRLDATGNVYGLRQLADFEGAYLEARSGWALGSAGQGVLWLVNAHGVVLRLRAQRRGLALTLGADGMVVSMTR